MNAAAHTFQINQLLNNSTVPYKFYKNDLDFEPCDLFALVNFFFFFFWDINFSYEKSIPLIYHGLILVCPARVKASSYGHAFKFIQCLPRNTRKGLMTSFLIFYIKAKKKQYHYSKLTVPPLQAPTTFDRAFYKLRWPGLCNLLSILVYAPALATRRLALHFLVPSV